MKIGEMAGAAASASDNGAEECLFRAWGHCAGGGVGRHRRRVLLSLIVLVLVLSLRGRGASTKKDTRNTRTEKTIASTDAKPVYLAELPEQDVVVGSGKLGKKNDLGYNNAKIVVKGAPLRMNTASPRVG